MRVTIQFTLEPEHASFLEKASIYENKTVSGYVRELVIAHLSKVREVRSDMRSIEAQEEERIHG